MHQNQINCSLCETETNFYMELRNKTYYVCPTCHAIQMNPNDYIGRDDEEAFYQTHNNDVNDLGYQRFVSPLVELILSQCDQSQKGLDFGAGTGPVITKLLNDKGYDITLYDPFFWKDDQVLEEKYDFIVSCEVIEHFHNPMKEFKLLKSLLKEHGLLILKTDLYKEDTDFKSWYYKDDPTHVFFYTEPTFHWIKENLGFKSVSIVNRVIQFSL